MNSSFFQALQNSGGFTRFENSAIEAIGLRIVPNGRSSWPKTILTEKRPVGKRKTFIHMGRHGDDVTRAIRGPLLAKALISSGQHDTIAKEFVGTNPGYFDALPTAKAGGFLAHFRR